MFDFTNIYTQITSGLGIYFTTNYLLDKYVKPFSPWFMKEWFLPIVLLHNVSLTIYSAWTFQASVQAMYTSMTWEDIMYPTMNQTALHNPYFYHVANLFYFSKYYEFIDTWITYLKGRKPIFLQVFHHTGAVILMGLGVSYKCHGIWVFVVFNSFVHTVMYSYYSLSTIGLRVPFKSSITILQLLQFVVGIQFAYYYNLFTEQTLEQNIVLKYIILYLIALIYLFTAFYQKNYTM
jgi:hypothetical protein